MSVPFEDTFSWYSRLHIVQNVCRSSFELNDITKSIPSMMIIAHTCNLPMQKGKKRHLMVECVCIFLSQILVGVFTGPRHPFMNDVLETMKG